MAVNFFAQIKDTRSNHDFSFVMGSLWGRAMQHKLRETDLSFLDSLIVEDQCQLIAEFFKELNEEMNRTYNPKSWRRQDALMSFAGSFQQEMGGDITEAPKRLIVESNSHVPTDVLNNPASELIT